MNRKHFKVLMALLLALAMNVLAMSASIAASPQFAGGTGTKKDPYHIQTVKQLKNIDQDLDAHYVLDNDLDLSSEVSWSPISAFSLTDETYFSGSFDGKGHTIRNLSISNTELVGGGLFGFVDGATIQNLTLKNVNIRGLSFAGALAAMAEGGAVIQNIRLCGSNNLSGVMYIGGVLGAAEDAIVRHVTAEANVTMRSAPVVGQAAGIVWGGGEDADFLDCHAVGGTVTVYGTESSGAVGGLGGSAQEAKYIRNCSAENVTVITRNCTMVGGLLGHAGSKAGLEKRSKRTEVTGCTVNNVVLKANKSCERIGMLVGSGYYRPLFQSEYPEPCAYYIHDCTVSGKMAASGTMVGSVAGYAGRNSEVKNVKTSVTLNNKKFTKQIGATIDEVPVSKLR